MLSVEIVSWSQVKTGPLLVSTLDDTCQRKDLKTY